MKQYQVITLVGGILLMLGAALPWATMTSSFLALSRSITGLEGDGILSAASGLILLVIALASKGQPGKIYSWIAVVVSILCGLLLASKVIALSGITTDASISTSLGLGLSCVSPLGVLFGLIGGMTKVPQAEEAVRVIPTVSTTPVETKAPIAEPPAPAVEEPPIPTPAPAPVAVETTIPAPVERPRPPVVTRQLKPISLPGAKRNIFKTPKISRRIILIVVAVLAIGALIFGGIFLVNNVFVAPTAAPTIDLVSIQLTAIQQVYAAKTQTALAAPATPSP